MTEEFKNPHQPETLDELIEKMLTHSNRTDFSDQYLIENNEILPYIGEWTYGSSYTPTSWVLDYLIELQKLKKYAKGD